MRSGKSADGEWGGEGMDDHRVTLPEALNTQDFILFYFYLFIFLRYAGLSLLWPLPLRSTGSRRAGSAAMAHGPRLSVTCGIFLDRGTNPCPLHRQVDSQPLHHQGSPHKMSF